MGSDDLSNLEEYFRNLKYNTDIVWVIASVFYMQIYKKKAEVLEIDFILEEIETELIKEQSKYNDLLNIMQSDFSESYKRRFGSTDEESIRRLEQDFDDLLDDCEKFNKNIDLFKEQLISFFTARIVQDDTK